MLSGIIKIQWVSFKYLKIEKFLKLKYLNEVWNF